MYKSIHYSLLYATERLSNYIIGYRYRIALLHQILNILQHRRTRSYSALNLHNPELLSNTSAPSEELLGL